MPRRMRIIHPSHLSEIDHILLCPGIGGCRWPLSPLLERHLYATVSDPVPPLSSPRRRSLILTILAARILKH